MDPGSTTLAALLAVAFLALGLLSVFGGALGGLSRSRFQHMLDDGTTELEAIRAFEEQPGHYLATIGVARTLTVLAAGALATALGLYLNLSQSDLVLGAVLLIVAALIFGHALPRAVVAGRAEEVALATALPIRATHLLATPASLGVTFLANLFVRVLGRSATAEDLAKTPEEFREVFGERVVEADEREMIDGIFHLEETTAREIMVPRMDVVALQATTDVANALDVFIKEGYSRLPVYEESIDDVVGILYAKDLFPLVRSGQLSGQVRDLARPAYFIPESKKIDELLRELQRRKVHIAVVVDEYGGTAGLVTIEDLLEEIVGEIQDEFDQGEEEKIIEGTDGEAIFDATVSIDDVNETLDLHLAGEEVDTIGGLVYERLGKVPMVGDHIDADGATVTVVSTVGRRIKRIKVAKVLPASNGSVPPAA